jgi:4'-phosphopantetheinyl transferase
VSRIGAVHVWTATVDTRSVVLERLARTLSPSQNARTDAFRFERHRAQHVFRCGMLRSLLASYTRTEPEQLVFAVNAFGKPMLAGAPADVHASFNLSHSDELVVVAIAAGPELGVDVEAIRPIPDLEAIARHHFAAAERGQLAAAPAGQREALFLRLWTRKEAYVKAVGRGLSMPLDSFDVSASDRPVRSACTEWWLHDLRMPPGYVGALAVQDRAAPIESSEWRPVFEDVA